MTLFFFSWTIFIPYSYAVVSAPEHEVKAAFLYNLGKFITWPSDIFDQQKDEFFICIFGQDPFEDYIDMIAEAKKVQKRKIIINRFNQINQNKQCNIIFITKSEQSKLEHVLNWAKGKPILTVSDINSFIEKGGMIKFYKRHGRVNIAVAINRLERHHLKASARLLSIVKIVED